MWAGYRKACASVRAFLSLYGPRTQAPGLHVPHSGTYDGGLRESSPCRIATSLLVWQKRLRYSPHRSLRRTRKSGT